MPGLIDYITNKHNIIHIQNNKTMTIDFDLHSCRWPPERKNMFTYQSGQQYKFKTHSGWTSECILELHICFVRNLCFKQKLKQYQTFPTETQIIITNYVNNYNKIIL